MKTNEIFYSQGKNDECETLDYAVKPILKYLPKDKTIWCPFDKETSQFYIQLCRGGGRLLDPTLTRAKTFIPMSLTNGILLYPTRHSQIRRKYLNEP